MLSEHGGTGVSSYQATPPLLDVSPPVCGASGLALSSVSRKLDLSVGALHDILSSARAGDVQGSSWLPGVSGPSISLAVTSPSVSRVLPDVRPSHPSSAITYLLLLALLSLLLPFVLLLHFQTPSWVLPGRVSLSRCSTLFAVLPVSLLVS